MSVDYHKKRFHAVQNEDGDVGAGTIFYYQQDGNLVWAEYAGGEVVKGHLIALADDSGCLDMRYQHLSKDGQLKTGVCSSRPEILPDGRLRVHERWRWTCGDGAEGESIIEEIKE